MTLIKGNFDCCIVRGERTALSKTDLHFQCMTSLTVYLKSEIARTNKRRLEIHMTDVRKWQVRSSDHTTVFQAISTRPSQTSSYRTSKVQIKFVFLFNKVMCEFVKCTVHIFHVSVWSSQHHKNLLFENIYIQIFLTIVEGLQWML